MVSSHGFRTLENPAHRYPSLHYNKWEREIDKELFKMTKNLTDTGKGKHVVRGPPEQESCQGGQ